MLFLSAIYATVWSTLSIPFLVAFPILFSLHTIFPIASELLVQPKIPSWLCMSPRVLQIIFFISIIGFGALDQKYQFFSRLATNFSLTQVTFLWCTSAILAFAFIRIACSKREYTPLRIIESDDWNWSDRSNIADNLVPMWWKNWANGLFDRRLDIYLSNTELNGISSMINHWMMGNKIFWFIRFYSFLLPTLFFIFPLFLFPPIDPSDFKLSTVLRYILWGCASSLWIVPTVVAAEWSRRRKVLELESLRPVGASEFQMQIAAAFVWDVLPSISIAGIGFLGLWWLIEDSASSLQVVYFSLIWGPSAIAFVVAVAAAFFLLDNIGARFIIGLFAVISGGIAYACYLNIDGTPETCIFVSAIYFIMSLVWLHRLYQMWEDMELGRRDSVEFD
jgi:hypothetical protein